MAKENYVFIIGILKKNTVFIKDKDGHETELVMSLQTIRRGVRDKYGDFDAKWDNPILRTKEPRLMEAAHNFRINDIIETKCVIVTDNVPRAYTCPHCGKKMIEKEYITYLTPVSMAIRGHYENISDPHEELMKEDVAEVSNTVKLIGKVVNPDGPRYRISEQTGKRSCIYQLAVNRKFKIYGSAALYGVTPTGHSETDQDIKENRSDYIWIKSYDYVAEENSRVLHPGSMIYVDGYFHTQPIEKPVQCTNPECGLEFKTKKLSMMVTPYEVEYLADCDTDEEREGDES